MSGAYTYSISFDQMKTLIKDYFLEVEEWNHADVSIEYLKYDITTDIEIKVKGKITLSSEEVVIETNLSEGKLKEILCYHFDIQGINAEIMDLPILEVRTDDYQKPENYQIIKVNVIVNSNVMTRKNNK